MCDAPQLVGAQKSIRFNREKCFVDSLTHLAPIDFPNNRLTRAHTRAKVHWTLIRLLPKYT